jgi:hypothetical protein
MNRKPINAVRGALIVVPLVVGLAFAGASSATAPTFSDEHVHVVANPYIVCSGFVAVGDFDVTRNIATFYDSDGNAVSRTAHISVEGTLTNSLTGVSLRLTRHGTFTQDLIDGSTFTLGQRTLVTAPGEGIVLQDMGRIVREGGAIVFEAGPSDFLDYQSGDATGVEDLCAALAA